MLDDGRAHIAVDALGAKQSGSATVLLDVLNALVEHDRVGRVTLYSAPPEDRKFSLPLSTKLIDSPQPAYEASIVRRVLWNSSVVGRTARRDRADLVVSMAATMSTDPSMPYVSFVQQSLPFCHEALATLSIQQRMRMGVVRSMTAASCRNARKVYVQTPTMRAWVTDAFDISINRCQVVFPDPRVLPVSELVSPVLSVMAATPKGSRLLYVGNSEAYKNVEVVIRALPEIRRNFPSVRLFVTWPDDHWACRQGLVTPLGYLRADVLGSAYALADVLVQPSLVESGPLTMTEAMGVGTPVVVADRQYARDICEDAALFFDPREASHCAEQVLRLLSDKALRDRLVTAGTKLVHRRISQKPYQAMTDSILEVASV